MAEPVSTWLASWLWVCLAGFWPHQPPEGGQTSPSREEEEECILVIYWWHGMDGLFVGKIWGTGRWAVYGGKVDKGKFTCECMWKIFMYYLSSLLAQNNHHCHKHHHQIRGLVWGVAWIQGSLSAHSIFSDPDPPQAAKGHSKSSSLFDSWRSAAASADCPKSQSLPVTSWFTRQFHTHHFLANLRHEPLLLFPFYTRRNGNSEKLNDLPKSWAKNHHF